MLSVVRAVIFKSLAGDLNRKQLEQTFDPSWLIDARYEPGRVTLILVSTKTLQPFRWSDTIFRRCGSNS
jgi:hypothetical protein